MGKSVKRTRHILALSGGKDSAALAIYMKDRVPEMEYVFCDTDKELKETYDYLDRLAALLEKPIVRLTAETNGRELTFDDLLAIRKGFLPSPQMRWCTEYLKIKPYERYIDDDEVISYIGIRADEGSRKKYVSTKPNITPKYPFVEAGLRFEDIKRILLDSGLGLPEYYTWRSRSGCYFCFFQQRREWVGLLETHPDLFKKAMEYEKEDPLTGERYTWVQGESLAELAEPERIEQIKREYEQRIARAKQNPADLSLGEVFAFEPEESSSGCLICHL